MKLNYNVMHRVFSVADTYTLDKSGKFAAMLEEMTHSIRVRYVSKADMLPETRQYTFMYDEATKTMVVNRDSPENPSLEDFVYCMILVRSLLGFSRGNMATTLFDGLEGPNAPSTNDVYAYIAYLFIMVSFEAGLDSLSSYGGLFFHDGRINTDAFADCERDAPEVYDIRSVDAKNRFNLLLNYLAYKVYFKDRITVGAMEFDCEVSVILDLLEKFPQFVQGINSRNGDDRAVCLEMYGRFDSILATTWGSFVDLAFADEIAEAEAKRKEMQSVVNDLAAFAASVMGGLN